MTFDAWWQALVSIADSHNLDWMLGDQEYYQDAYDAGDTPEQVMQDIFDSVQGERQ